METTNETLNELEDLSRLLVKYKKHIAIVSNIKVSEIDYVTVCPNDLGLIIEVKDVNANPV